MIIGVAIKHKDVCICLPRPARHNDCIQFACDSLRLTPPICGTESYQGFYLADGTFLGREDALEYAKANDQLMNKQAHTRLFSEDLW